VKVPQVKEVRKANSGRRHQPLGRNMDSMDRSSSLAIVNASETLGW
jgi:hypothetical protein